MITITHGLYDPAEGVFNYQKLDAFILRLTRTDHPHLVILIAAAIRCFHVLAACIMLYFIFKQLSCVVSSFLGLAALVRYNCKLTASSFALQGRTMLAERSHGLFGRDARLIRVISGSTALLKLTR